MKTYFIFALVFFSLSAVAMKNEKAMYGQKDGSQSQNDCNAPHIAGCGPCYKLCVEQNKSERGQGEEVSGTKNATSVKPTKQSGQ